MSATRFYSSARWQKLRGAAIERDGGACRKCGWHSPDGRGLHVHHIIERAAGGPDELDNVITWCGPCHRRHTGQRQSAIFAQAATTTAPTTSTRPRLRTSQAW